MSLNSFPSRLGENHEPEPKVILCNSRLGEVDLLGRDLQGFKSVHALNSPNFAQFTQQNIPRQNSIIAQHKTRASTHQTCYFIYSYYPNSKLSHFYQIPYQNPHYTQYSTQDFTPKCPTNQFTFTVHRMRKCTSSITHVRKPINLESYHTHQ